MYCSFPKTCLPHQMRYVVIYPCVGKVQSSCQCLISLFLPWDFSVLLRWVLGSLWSRCVLGLGWSICMCVVFVSCTAVVTGAALLTKEKVNKRVTIKKSWKTGYFFLLYSCFCILRGLEYVRLSGNVCWIADCINSDLVFLLSSGMAFLTIKEWSVLCLGV